MFLNEKSIKFIFWLSKFKKITANFLPKTNVRKNVDKLLKLGYNEFVRKK